MLANILKSEQALRVSIEIVRYFVQLRHMIPAMQDIKHIIESIQNNVGEHDELIQQLCFDVQKLFLAEEDRIEQQNKRKI